MTKIERLLPIAVIGAATAVILLARVKFEEHAQPGVQGSSEETRHARGSTTTDEVYNAADLFKTHFYISLHQRKPCGGPIKSENFKHPLLDLCNLAMYK